jgi:hypothetical protein
MSDALHFEIVRHQHLMASKRSANERWALRADQSGAEYKNIPSSIPGHPGHAVIITRNESLCAF